MRQRQDLVVLADRLSRDSTAGARVSYLGTEAFGPELAIDRFQLGNGLTVLTLEEHSAPIVAYHTWYHVGSRNERPGCTGIAHFFEHMMFNATEELPPGEFDRRMEELGADSNAATWLDWTQYHVAVPEQALEEVIRLEAQRMGTLVLGEDEVASEKEVVKNERRYRVEDDVDGSLNEVLWSTAFRVHPYRWPTIGWMKDIEGYDVALCREFYDTYYAPNNATIVVAGAASAERVLRSVQARYGHYAASALPARSIPEEPLQRGERVELLTKPTRSERVAVGYRGPALAHPDHNALSLLGEILSGGRSSRLVQLLVRELEIATDVRFFVSPFRDPGLVEVAIHLREGQDAKQALRRFDDEVARLIAEGVAEEELARARARAELSLFEGFATADSKASNIGFYEVLLGQPAASWERLKQQALLTSRDLQRVAQRYLNVAARTCVFVRPGAEPAMEAE